MGRNDKVEKILDAAENVMSRVGLEDASISEIARNAGVTDSLIYNYFKGKEDLLFSIPGRRMVDVLENLLVQLQGIPDPKSKLSKMIWFHLHFNDTYRGYARLLLLECRSNINFYKHEAYTLIRKYAGIMLGILEEGVKVHAFREDLDLRLIRDIIFGLLDWETLSSLAFKEIEKSADDWEDILTIIFPMIEVVEKPKGLKVDKSISILEAAETVFAEKGYIQATVSEISKRAGVSEGTIYEYFRSKEDLLLSIPLRRFKEHISDLEEIFELKTPLRKLRRFIRYHFYLYLTEPNFLRVFLLNVQLNQKFYTSESFKIFKDYINILYEILEEGKKNGTIRKDVNTRVFRNLFLGTFSHMALRWLILGKEAETDKMREVNEVALLLSRAVAQDQRI